MAVAPVRVQVIEEAMPFGDVPLAPAAASGRSETELARAIAGLRESAPSAALASVAALVRRGSRPDADTRQRAA